MENVKIWNQEFAEKTTFGETPRSDFYEEEKRTLGIRIPASQNGKKRATNHYPQPKKAVELGHTANNVCIINMGFCFQSTDILFFFSGQVPESFNWFNVSGVQHPARAQGQCGSCWVSSAMGQLEMQAILEGHNFTQLSTQQGVDWFVHVQHAILFFSSCCFLTT